MKKILLWLKWSLPVSVLIISITVIYLQIISMSAHRASREIQFGFIYSVNLGTVLRTVYDISDQEYSPRWENIEYHEGEINHPSELSAICEPIIIGDGEIDKSLPCVRIAVSEKYLWFGFDDFPGDIRNCRKLILFSFADRARTLNALIQYGYPILDKAVIWSTLMNEPIMLTDIQDEGNLEILNNIRWWNIPSFFFWHYPLINQLCETSSEGIWLRLNLDE